MGSFPSIDDLSGKYPHQPIFVLGTSGSIKHLDLSRLENYVTIGTNDALEEWEVDYLLAVDGIVIDRVAKNWLYDRPDLILLTTLRHAERARDDLHVMCPIHVFRVHPGTMLNREGSLRQVDNTSHYAVEVAWRMMGCRGPGRIILLGVDMRYPTKEEEEKGETDHSWGRGGDRGCKPNFDKAIEVYPQTNSDLAKHGIDLITCSPWEGPLTSVLLWKTFEDLMDELDEERKS